MDPAPPPPTPIRTLARLVEEARAVGPLPVVVAGAESDTALAAVAHARRKRIAEGILVGGEPGIRARLAALGEDPARWRIVDVPSDAAAARRAVALVRDGEGAVLLKGRIKTADLLHAVLDRAAGLREGRLLSDVLVAEHPLSEEPRLVGVTDGGGIGGIEHGQRRRAGPRREAALQYLGCQARAAHAEEQNARGRRGADIPEHEQRQRRCPHEPFQPSSLPEAYQREHEDA